MQAYFNACEVKLKWQRDLIRTVGYVNPQDKHNLYGENYVVASTPKPFFSTKFAMQAWPRPTAHPWRLK